MARHRSATIVSLCLFLLASAGASASAGSSSGQSDPARRIALGVATPDGRSLQELDRFSASIGRRPAIWVIWSQWGLPSSQRFPSDIANGLAARNVTPMIWWEPIDPRHRSDGTYARHRNITAGKHDDYIRQYARDARAFGRTVLLRFAHEANGKYFPWSVTRFDNSPSTFIAAWRHVRTIFRQENATNVKFVWSVAKQRCEGGCNPYTAVYPGDAYVDIVGLSAHNWGTMKKWVSMYESTRRAAGLLRQITRRPLIVAESGSSPLGGDKAAWIREGYREVYRKLPAIRAIVYLNADLRDVGHPDWRIGNPTRALRAYAAVAASAEFSVTSQLHPAR
jgi:hypothetical protein